MRLHNLAAAALLGASMLTPNAPAQHLSADGAVQTFNFIADQYFSDVYFHFAPTAGTQAGLHQYDTQLEDYSAANIQKQIAALHTYEKKIVAIDPSALDASIAADRTILLNNIRSQLLTLEVIRPWEKNPDIYSSGITNAAFVIMERPYASTNTRLRSLVEREKLMPQVLLEARKNLKNPPKIYTEIALEQIDGLISFFQTDVPAAFLSGPDAATDADSQSRLRQIQRRRHRSPQILRRMDEVRSPPRSSGDYKFGADTFAKNSATTRWSTSLSTASSRSPSPTSTKTKPSSPASPKKSTPPKPRKRSSPNSPPSTPLPTNSSPHFRTPSPASSPSSTRTTSSPSPPRSNPPSKRRRPSCAPPRLPPWTRQAPSRPTPPRPTSTSPFLKKPGPRRTSPNTWPPSTSAPSSAPASTRPTPATTSSSSGSRNSPSQVRKVLGANTNVEGWAHYTEQMMLDEGYAAAPPDATPRPDPRSKAHPPRPAPGRAPPRRPLRQLHQAPHRPNSPFDQAVDFFVNEGYQSRSVGLVETKRGTADATYLYYTLGKLEIMKLRADMMKKQGTAFNLQHFHDNFMRQGLAPIKVIRKAMLHDDSPVL